MRIYNSENYFTNKQLEIILERLGDSYKIDYLYIIENDET